MSSSVSLIQSYSGSWGTRLTHNSRHPQARRFGPSQHEVVSAETEWEDPENPERGPTISDASTQYHITDLRHQWEKDDNIFKTFFNMMLAYLFETYGSITPVDLDQNFEAMRKAWDPQQPVETLFKQMQVSATYHQYK
jgi:hypothetical protein